MKQIAVQLVKNTFLTTGVTLCVLACVALTLDGTAIFVETIFQNLAANACIHLGFLLTKRFDSRYLLLDMAVDVVMVCTVVIGAGGVFGWYSSTPVGILVLMVLAVYAASTLLGIFRTQSDIRFINERLRQRREIDFN